MFPGRHVCKCFQVESDLFLTSHLCSISTGQDVATEPAEGPEGPESGGYYPPGVGHHPPGVGHHPPGVGHHPPGVGHHPPGVGHHPLGVGHHGIEFSQYRAFIALQAWKKAITDDPHGVTRTWEGPEVCDYKGVFCSPPENDEYSDIIVVSGIDLNHEDLGAPLFQN